MCGTSAIKKCLLDAAADKGVNSLETASIRLIGSCSHFDACDTAYWLLLAAALAALLAGSSPAYWA
jgi:hypothetical protein